MKKPIYIKGDDRIEYPLPPNEEINPYTQLSPRRTPVGPALSVRLREVSVL